MTERSSSLVDRYAGTFDGHLRFGKRPALLVIDVVAAYLDPASPLYDAAFVVALAAIKRLVGVARGAAIPVIFTNVIYQPGGRDGGLFYEKVPALKAFERGAPGGAFPPSLPPLPYETIVSKQYASAFFGTSLAATLTSSGIDTVILMGFSTSGCVRASALDALQHGFIPFVVEDACADRAIEPHLSSLFDLQAKYAEVVSESALMSLLNEHG